MSNQKSIIGQVYNAKNQPALDVEAGTRASLGKRPYKVVKDPYLANYPDCLAPVFGLSCFSPKKAMFINVLDERTGRIYQVAYEPGNLCNVWSEVSAKSSRSKNGDFDKEQMTFNARVGAIAEELKAMFDDKDTRNKCGVVFFATRENADGTSVTGSAFVGGGAQNIIRCVSASCSENLSVLQFLQAGATTAAINNAAKGGNHE